MSRVLILIALLVITANFTVGQTSVTAGSLTVVDSKAKEQRTCPLKHTDVRADISGFMSRVVVTQEFENPFKEKIEAVYVFPLPQKAAVDDMTMIVGDRVVKGKILPREEAQTVYEAAKAGGQVASLLDQERPNIFTQSVANILPGELVRIKISYVETLKYDDGSYEFVFPMVVGPRYVPRGPDEKNQVPDAARTATNTVPPQTRSSHDISLKLSIDAGLLLETVSSKSHDIDLARPGPRNATVQLKDQVTIPNRDFVLRFDVAGKSIQDALITHRSGRGGFFSLMIQPPEQVNVPDVTPKELVFVLDTSGSMSGFPIEKAKETMKMALDGLYPGDTFNLITFAGDTHVLFPEPVSATPENLKKAQDFLASRSGEGGTEMMKAIQVALKPSSSTKHMRIVCFMTDGYVGNDMNIIAEIQKHQNARVFSFGIGESVNRFLLDKMAEAGRGEVEYVSLNDDGSAAARRFHERVRNPLLTDLTIDWNGLPVADVYPKRIPDLFSAKPVIVTGRYTGTGTGALRLKGRMAGTEYVREIPVDFPETMALHDVLPQLWARGRVDDLMNHDFNNIQNGNANAEVKNTITQLGIEYRLMTQFTSFVAVEEMIVTEGGLPRRVDVPVELPSGSFGSGPVPMGAAAGSPNGFIGQFWIGRRNNAVQTMTSTVQVQSSAALISVSPGTAPAPKPTVAPSTASATAGGAGPVQVIAPIASLETTAGSVLTTKLSFHSSVEALIERLKKTPSLPSFDEYRFVINGKAELQVWLTEKSAENIEKLKALGFEVVLDPKSAKVVIGRIAIEKVEKLKDLDFVRYVAPQLKK
jgi:Ca-activated chloride channel homolog